MIIRRATPADAPQMADLLNEIIKIGGTTAHQTPFDATRMVAEYVAAPTQLCCHLAEEDGVILGFQHLDGPDPAQGGEDGWAYIASFVVPEAAGKGIGQRLFSVTRDFAAAAGVISINATIRADNSVGLRYYRGLGFVDYHVEKDAPLRDGTLVDRIATRFDLNC